jgi:hypothetical protein
MATRKHISNTGSNQEEYRFALRYLAEYLEQIHGQPVVEYDQIAQDVMQGMRQKSAILERLAA